jgi:hypothetical protein
MSPRPAAALISTGADSLAVATSCFHEGRSRRASAPTSAPRACSIINRLDSSHGHSAGGMPYASVSASASSHRPAVWR